MLRLLINLDRSPDRLGRMRAEFDRLGLDFRRVPAVDWHHLATPDIAHVTKPRFNGIRWSKAEVACFLSHRECWKIAAESAESHIAIFEDDIHLAGASARLLLESSWIPDGVEIVKLETFRKKTRLGRNVIQSGDHALCEIRARHLGSAGYIIARSVASHLLELSHHFDRPVDVFLFDPRTPGKNFNCYQINPAICVQELRLDCTESPLPSVIEESRIEKRGLWSRTVKRKGVEKLKRELIRPFEQIMQVGRAMLYGERTVEVPYEWPGNTRRYRRHSG